MTSWHRADTIGHIVCWLTLSCSVCICSVTSTRSWLLLRIRTGDHGLCKHVSSPHATKSEGWSVLSHVRICVGNFYCHTFEEKEHTDNTCLLFGVYAGLFLICEKHEGEGRTWLCGQAEFNLLLRNSMEPEGWARAVGRALQSGMLSNPQTWKTTLSLKPPQNLPPTSAKPYPNLPNLPFPLAPQAPRAPNQSKPPSPSWTLILSKLPSPKPIYLFIYLLIYLLIYLFIYLFSVIPIRLKCCLIHQAYHRPNPAHRHTPQTP